MGYNEVLMPDFGHFWGFGGRKLTIWPIWGSKFTLETTLEGSKTANLAIIGVPKLDFWPFFDIFVIFGVPNMAIWLMYTCCKYALHYFFVCMSVHDHVIGNYEHTCLVSFDVAHRHCRVLTSKVLDITSNYVLSGSLFAHALPRSSTKAIKLSAVLSR